MSQQINTAPALCLHPCPVLVPGDLIGEAVGDRFVVVLEAVAPCLVVRLVAPSSADAWLLTSARFGQARELVAVPFPPSMLPEDGPPWGRLETGETITMVLRRELAELEPRPKPRAFRAAWIARSSSVVPPLEQRSFARLTP